MKRCPQCHQIYPDETLKFCRDDGAPLQENSSAPGESSSTLILPAMRTSDALPTQLLQSDAASTQGVGSPAGGAPAAKTSKLETSGNSWRRKRGMAVAVGLLVAVVAGVGWWFYQSSTGGGKKPGVSFGAAKFTRLTTSGKESGVAISPDGKYVAHVIDEGGRQSLWVRQVATASNLQIVPPAEMYYRGLTFSPDGDYIYYAVREKDDQRGALYQVPVFGGAAGRKLLTGISNSVTFSPDGQRIAFFRTSTVESAREDALIIANADGTGEKILAARSRDERFHRGSFSNPSWSPDGKSIACPIGNFAENLMSVAAVSVESGEVRVLTPQKWFAVRQVAWLADGERVLFNALEHAANVPYQIWQVAYKTGEVQRVTNDLISYRMFSLTADSDALAVIQGEAEANIWVMPASDSTRATQITQGRSVNSELSWTPDGRILYNSNVNGGVDIYLMDARGGAAKQLTANSKSNSYPQASPDGRYVVFMSDRAGPPNIWRMDFDGANLKRLTDDFDLFPSISPDGRWVVYQSRSGDNILRKVAIDGGQPVQLTNFPSGRPVVSPDGKWIACTYQENRDAPVKIAVISSEGGPPLKTFPLLSDVEATSVVIRWTADGREVVYPRTINGVSNLWTQPVEGGQPRQITNFTSNRIFWFDFSRDGKQLALARGTLTGDIVLIRDFG